MKYLFYILAITFASCLIGILIVPAIDQTSNDEVASLVINQRAFSAAEIENRKQHSPYHSTGDEAFLDDLIAKELLIQEAQRLEINQEESFRLAIKKHYEQALIKELLDRKYQALNSSPDQQALARTKTNLLSHFELAILTYPDLLAVQNNLPSSKQEIASDYLDLTEDVRDLLGPLSPGNLSAAVAADDHYIRVQLISKTPFVDQAADQYPAESVNQLCAQELQRQAMTNWLNQLRQSAHITRPAEQANREI